MRAEVRRLQSRVDMLEQVRTAGSRGPAGPVEAQGSHGAAQRPLFPSTKAPGLCGQGQCDVGWYSWARRS